jgi:hypothetical protein
MIGQNFHFVAAKARSNFDAMSSGFRGRRAELTWDDLIWTVAVVIVAAIGLWILTRLARRGTATSFTGPQRLFWALCRAHRLDWSSRRLLRQIARWQRLKQPAHLFLEPHRFAAVNLSPPLLRKQTRIKALQRKLFGVEALPEQSEAAGES